jgi:signal transduction histidine kinase/ActR/RegA family two-component response regulator
VGRWIAGATSVAYPAHILLGLQSKQPIHDPLIFRVGVPAIAFAVFVSSFTSSWARRHFTALLTITLYSITAHIAYLLATNHLQPQLALEMMVALAAFIGLAPHLVSSQWKLFRYLASAAAACGLVVFYVERPLLDPRLFAATVGTVLFVAFVSIRDHIRTLSLLLRSEQRLQGDVDARELSEARLKESEARANALLDAVPDTLVRLSSGGLVLGVRNDETTPIGKELAASIGAPLDTLFGMGESTIGEAVADAMQSGKVTQVATEVRAGDRVRMLEVRVARTGDAECLAIVRDVTQEREMEARLRVADRLVSLGTLASGVAHEINNPLSYVVANVDFVVEGLKKLPIDHLAEAGGSELLDALGEIREGGRRIASIVESLRYQARQDDEHAAPADANAAVEAALRILDNQLRYRTRVELALGKLSFCLVHERRLVQVIVNLLSNALDAFPPRSSDQNLIRVVTRGGAAGITVEVHDNGLGVSEAVRDRIFDPFFTTKAPGVGTGLGLYLCHQYIAAAGGSIELLSREGEGATFRIQLPLAQTARTASIEPAAPSLPPSRILVVDDDALVARSLARMLRGHELVLSGDGEAALWECLSRDFDLILCDLMMPRLDGAGFYTALREHRPKLASRVVFMTGGAFTAETRSFLDGVPNPCMEKPIQAGRLFDAARRQMSQADGQASSEVPTRASARPPRVTAPPVEA